MRTWLRELKERQFKRALAFEWQSSPRLGYFANLFGAGHMLPVTYQLHRLCMQLERYCYVKLYDTDFERYFTYEGGLSWDRHHWRRRGLRCKAQGSCANHSSTAQITLDSSKTHRDRVRFWNYTLLPSITNPKYANISLLKVRVLGHLPLLNGLTPTSTCFNRFVTAPPSHRLSGSRVPSTAVHLRTGFADIDGRIGKVTLPDAGLSAAWFHAACGKNPFPNARMPRILFSDSPGLLRYATRLHPHLTATVLNATGEPTRSWFTSREMKYATLDDIVLAGMATELQVAPQTSLQERYCREVQGRCLVRRPEKQISRFHEAVLERSVCNSKVRLSVNDCSMWSDVFVRDMTSWLNFKGSSTVPSTAILSARDDRTKVNATGSRLKVYVPRRWQQLKELLPNDHPCANLKSGIDCYLSFAAALK